jgi:hypothetical protein
VEAAMRWRRRGVIVEADVFGEANITGSGHSVYKLEDLKKVSNTFGLFFRRKDGCKSENGQRPNMKKKPFASDHCRFGQQVFQKIPDCKKKKKTPRLKCTGGSLTSTSTPV